MAKYIRDNTKFGGLIYESDFNTECGATSKHLVQRIVRDWAFDKQCLRNAQERERRRTYESEHR